MPKCLNCGHHVTPRYAAVFSTRDDSDVETCPRCEDMTRGRDGRARQNRSVAAGQTDESNAATWERDRA